MTVKVLGPLDTGSEPLSPRERAILAALVVRLGTSVAPSELADAYWGEGTPSTWGQQIKTSIARIRTRLGRESVETVGSEYRLGVSPDTIDAVRFERMVSQARQHGLHGDSERAIDAYRRALALWRGIPFPELPDWEPAIAEAMRLGEIRSSAEEELLDVRLRNGEHRAVIADAERLLREQPLREDRWAILALADYQSGRQADALALLRAARERLADDLGIEPGTRLTQLEGAILRQDASITAPAAQRRISSECPYPGLAAFAAANADEFFGREHDIEVVVERLRPGAVVTVAGASGSGKSSLMLAGVVPHLQSRGATVLTLRDGSGFGAALRVAIEAADPPDVIVIDQAEELLRDADSETEIEAVCVLLRAFLDRGGALGLTIRSDFLDRAGALPRIGADIGRGVYLLGPLSRDAMRQAIEQPARRAGLRLEQGFVELVLRDASGRSSTLPHLSHALLETWARREGGVLTIDGYEAAGGIAGAIAQSAEDLYRSLSPHEQDLCRALMLRLVERGADGASVRRRVTAAPLLADPDRHRVIEALVEARLLTLDGESIIVAHEAVATAWPRLDAWLEDDAAGSRIMRMVDSTATAWDAAGRPPDELLRGARLHAALEWRQASADLTAVEIDFLEASAAAESTELRRVEEVARRERRQNGRLRWALGIGAGLLVVSLATSAVAVVRGNDAAAAAEDATIEAVTSQSLSLRATNRDIAALMAVEAHRLWPDDSRTRAALMGTMTAAGPFVSNVYIPDAEWRIGAWPIPGTETVAVVRDYTHLEIHDARTGELVRAIADLPDTDALIRPWVRVSADGSTILVMQHQREDVPDREDLDVGVDEDELVHFFDVATGARVGDPVLVDDITPTVSLSPDGAMATWATLGSLVVVDRDTGAVRRTDATYPSGGVPPDTVGAFAQFQADGSIVATSLDDVGRVLDAASLDVLREFALPAGSGAEGVAVTPDGLMVTFGARTITVIDVATGEPRWERALSLGQCSRLVASGVQRLVICGDESGRLHWWNLDTGDLIGGELDYQLSAGGDLALTDDETELLLMSAISPSIGRARIDGGGPAATALGGPGLRAVTAFDASGRLTVLADPSTQTDEDVPPAFRVWDVVRDESVLRIPEDLPELGSRQVWDVRWAGADTLIAWTFDPPAHEEDAAAAEATQPGVDPDSLLWMAEGVGLIDVATGRFTESEVPTNLYSVFTDPGAQVVYAALFDRPETEAEEPSEVRAYDARSWERLPLTIDVDGRVEFLSTTPDRSRILVSTGLDGEPALNTALYDRTGSLIDEGLPTAQRALILSDGSSVAVAAQRVDLYAPDGLERAAALPANTGWVWNLSASRDDTLLLGQGAGERSVSLMDLSRRAQWGDSLYGNPDGSSWLRPDGSGLVVSGAIGTAYWTLDAGAQADAACRLAGREPTADEWDTYFGEFGDQRPICDAD